MVVVKCRYCGKCFFITEDEKQTCPFCKTDNNHYPDDFTNIFGGFNGFNDIFRTT